ncbi:hypothetical protein [Pseudomarimonas arenosa]|uniref:Uncharacterized protein n=1 Tax=Pseudomarimonas arenosa TaxID=2774145 RepID=A0AAW3ZK81_9GAMM|nr:hypothetical protein [Pseudomarimonas arenosa]MBD8526533.1 hypothetical protein [Pseudomarimonas arenosa]
MTAYSPTPSAAESVNFAPLTRARTRSRPIPSTAPRLSTASPNGLGRWLLVGAAVLVMAAVLAAVIVMGTPAAQREMRLDERRAADLQRIVKEISDLLPAPSQAAG